MHEQVASRLSYELKRRRDVAARENRPLEAMSEGELDDVYTRIEAAEARAQREARQVARIRRGIADGTYPPSEALDATIDAVAALIGSHV